MNLVPFRQRLIEFRRKPLEPTRQIDVMRDYGMQRITIPAEWSHVQVCDDLDDLIREVERLRLENDRLRVEKARTCGECRNWRFKSEATRAFGVCDSPQVADYTKILIHGRPDLQQEIKDYGRLETDERFCCMFWEAQAIGSERKE